MNKEESTIPKPILIIGKGPSGKSFLARNISCVFLNSITLFGKELINKSKRELIFSSIDLDKDLIIIDDVPKKNLFDTVNASIWSIYVERIGKSGCITKQPQLIITADISEGEVDKQIRRAFRVIETRIDKSDNCNPIFYKKEL